ncbi:unnamed protein product, partial [Amoebophrya sp. A25]|eukprot:GSA25T00001152001.1
MLRRCPCKSSQKPSSDYNRRVRRKLLRPKVSCTPPVACRQVAYGLSLTYMLALLLSR